jgi:hypothetical protein
MSEDEAKMLNWMLGVVVMVALVIDVHAVAVMLGGQVLVLVELVIDVQVEEMDAV